MGVIQLVMTWLPERFISMRQYMVIIYGTDFIVYIKNVVQ